MGWDFRRGATKQDIVNDRTRTRSYGGRRQETLKHTVVGKVLWAVQRLSYLDVEGQVAEKEDGTPEQETFIACYLLENQVGFGWGYKDLCEDMNPYYFDCPISYLDMAPERCAEWRATVREQHAAKAAKRKEQNAVNLEVGQTVRLVDGCTPGYLKVTSLKPLQGTFGGETYRIKRRLIAPPNEQEVFRAQEARINAQEGSANV